MSSLPIDHLKNEFLKRIQHTDLVVEAQTGSGKSTRLPLWLSERGRVLVVEPRRIACTSLAQFLATTTESELGKEVGYAIKLDNRYDDKTKVVFVTPGVALRWYSDNQLADFDYIVVDEYHERRWDTDLLVALLRRPRAQKLVVTSATLDGEKLARYLGAERLSAEGRVYEVSLCHRATHSQQLPDGRRLDERVFEEVAAMRDLDGDILVFLPGRKEIAQCASRLAQLEQIIVAPLHASVTEHQRDVALTVQAKKKIVLATNVAETSLTIDNIGLVIDSGLERRTEQRNGKTTLSLKAISKASAKQRAGRAGRVMEGVCVRLYGEHAALIEHTPPEMQREALTEAMLAAAVCGKPLSQLDFLDPLPERSLNQAALLLRAMQAVDEKGVATEHGKRLYPLPIDALYADLVSRMPKKALKEAMIDMTAVLATPASLYKLTADEERLSKLDQLEPLGCDGALAIGLVRGKRYTGVEVDAAALDEAQRLSMQMRELFELPQLEVASRYQHSELIAEIARLHPELAFVRRLKRPDAFANGELEVQLPRQHRLKAQTQGALVLDTHSLPGRGVKQTLNLATFILPLPLDTFATLNLGEWREGEVVEGDQTQVTLELVYAGRVVATRLEEATGTLAMTPLMDAVYAQRVLPGFAHKMTKAIKHYVLYQQLAGEAAPAVTFESWFREQLALLELSSVEELALFSEDDFAFEGIPYWEYEEFAQTYPFECHLGDLNLRVEYYPTRKCVEVIYDSGLRKGDPKRWELPKWQGWRVQYRKASRVVDIR
ncbi:ATP-dependent RNA helicase [Vibrio cholerae]